jgi:uncharacterized protein involved in exopolysaccharide biosynthesis/Mrp family chromosome partitioning ATPase
VINSEIQIFTSRDLIEKVVDEMGFLRFAGEATNNANQRIIAANLQSSLQIEVPKNSNIISVKFDGPDPTVAQEFLRRLTDAYLTRHVEIHRSVGAYEFLSQQTDQLRSRLSETEDELQKIKYSEGIVAIEDSKKMSAARIEELTKGLGELEAELAASQARVEFFKGLVPVRRVTPDSNITRAVTTNAEPLALMMRLQRQRQKEAELLAAYTEDSIPVRSIRDQIKETQRILDGMKLVEVPTNVIALSDAMSSAGLPEVVNEDLALIASLQAKMAVHKTRLKQTLDEARRIDAVEAKIVELQRKKDLQEVNYRYLSQSLERARIDDALNSGKISNISVVQPATLPTQPMRVDLFKRMGLALFFGVALGLGLAMAKEYVFDHTIRSAAELRARLRFPLLVSVPEVGADHKAMRRSQKSLALPAHEAAQGDEAEAWGAQKDLHAYCETLRDRLLMTLGDSSKPPHVIGITSCIRGAGVSTIATGLALELSRAGDRPVLLISSGENSSLPKIFGVNPFAGITDEGSPPGDTTALVQRNVYFVPAEETGKEWAGATPAQRFAEMIPFVRNGNSRFVIVDLPPVDETSLALRVGRLLDGVVLVIPSEKVNRHAAIHAVEELERSGIKVIGTILNQRRQYIPEWLYRLR